MGLVWIKALTLQSGHANVIGHVDRVLAMLAAGSLDPTPLVTHHMTLDDAPEAYAALRPPRGAEDRPHAVGVAASQYTRGFCTPWIEQRGAVGDSASARIGN